MSQKKTNIKSAKNKGQKKDEMKKDLKDCTGKKTVENVRGNDGILNGLLNKSKKAMEKE